MLRLMPSDLEGVAGGTPAFPGLFARPSSLALAAALFLVMAVWSPCQKPKKGQEERPVKGEIPVVTGESKTVTFNVTVTDSKGNLVTGLKSEHFRVTENGAPCEIRFFEPDSAPVTMVLLVEFSRSTSYAFEDIRAMGNNLVNGLRESDYFALVTFNNFPAISQDFTDSKEEASMAVARLRFTTFGGIDLWRALKFVVDSMADIKGKKGVVLLSTGLSTSVGGQDEMSRFLRRSGVPVYAVSMGQHDRNAADPYMSEDAHAAFFQADYRLRRVASDSGGASFFPQSAGAFPSCVGQTLLYLRNQYLLAYAPPDPGDEKRKRSLKIEAEVDVNRDGKPEKLRVTHVKEYVLERKAQ